MSKLVRSIWVPAERNDTTAAMSAASARRLIAALTPRVALIERIRLTRALNGRRIAREAIEAVRCAHIGGFALHIEQAHALYDRLVDAHPDLISRVLAKRARLYSNVYPEFYFGLLAHSADRLKARAVPEWKPIAALMPVVAKSASSEISRLDDREFCVATMEHVLGAEACDRDPAFVRFLIDSGELAFAHHDDARIETVGIQLERALARDPLAFVETVRSAVSQAEPDRREYYDRLVHHVDAYLRAAEEAREDSFPTARLRLHADDEEATIGFLDLAGDDTPETLVDEAVILATVGSFQYAYDFLRDAEASPEEHQELLARYVQQERLRSHFDHVALAYAVVGDHAAAALSWEAWGDHLTDHPELTARADRHPRLAYEHALEELRRSDSSNPARAFEAHLVAKRDQAPSIAHEPGERFFDQSLP